jgi:hypothetical protein
MMSQDGFSCKAKAKELVDKIYNAIVIDGNNHNAMAKSLELAKMFCTEITNYEFFGSQTQKYWGGVKKELEKN